MFKKITFGVIGLIGLSIFLLSSPAHAATTAQAPQFDAQTRSALGQTLNVLQVVLNQISARANNVQDPIENPALVNQTLGVIKGALIAIDTSLSGIPAPIAQGNPGTPSALPSGSLEGSGASVTANAQPATVSWFLSPKILFVLLPLAILLVVALSFTKRKEIQPIAKDVLKAEPEQEIKTA